MLILVLMAAGVVVLCLPALVLGARRLTRRGPRSVRSAGGSRSEFVVVLLGRTLGLLAILVLSALVLVASIGALVRDLHDVPSLVYVAFVLDLLLAALVVLTSGGSRRPRARRRASPAAR
ncbi:hypothetical protein SAMN03159343_0057 [Klenkia marina]|uniref:Uncharacterized protein n=1 Tax=Klenkia marina TaxID=1960309 RepID=A0A1G4Z639_9ACTN|nr:hypothetical protein [Klenkia marina]SCX61134.1 hypothetical protein SAMN03159343_0057 [Klenkia marina]